MAKTVDDFILGVLDNLSPDQLDRFKHKLSALHGIGYGLIENEKNAAITRRIINKFTKKHAIARTAEVLRAMDLHDQAGGLEEANARILPVLLPPSPPEAVSAGPSSAKTTMQTMVRSAVGQGASSAAGTGDTGGRASDSSFTPTEVSLSEMAEAGDVQEVMEKLKKTGLQAAPPAHCDAGPGDVACDFCTGRKRKAVKFCLVCLASYGQTHLQPHYESPAFKKHNLSPATGHLQEKICSLHHKLLDIYCRRDQQCICVLCEKDKHKGHDTVSAAAERTEKQKQLGSTQRKYHQRIQEREKKILDLRQAKDSLTRSAQAAVEDSESFLTELIRSFERMRSKVTELIRDQEKAEVSRVERHLEQLEQKIAELSRRDTEMEQLLHAENHIHFLQSYQSVCAPPGPGDLPSITVNQHASFEAVRKHVSELKEQLEDFCKGGLVKISQTVKEVHILEPRTREQFLQYSCHLTLDPNTAHKLLRLSEGNRDMKNVDQDQSYPDHPERFDYWAQVLCREGLSGRCYWEAEWSGRGVHMSVSYKEISRKGWGVDCGLGGNDKSWSLICSPSSCCFRHNKKDTKLPARPSSRIGVYLDHGAGTLSFYSVSDTMTLLHRVQTTFTQPLHPGFGVYDYVCSVKLCDLG